MEHIPLVRKKLTKDNVYEKEQKAILESILKIIGMTADDGMMIRKDLLEPRLAKITELINQIKTYYSSDVTSQVNRATNKEMSAIRAVLKHHGLKFTYKTTSSKNKDDELIVAQHYYVTALKKL